MSLLLRNGYWKAVGVFADLGLKTIARLAVSLAGAHLTFFAE
jgi:hypothetical protein